MIKLLYLTLATLLLLLELPLKFGDIAPEMLDLALVITMQPFCPLSHLMRSSRPPLLSVTYLTPSSSISFLDTSCFLSST